MVAKELAFKISANPDEAIRGFGKVAKAAQREMGKTEQAVDDTRTAAQRLADQMDQTAGELEGELRGMVRSAEALGEALGPDLARKVGSAGIGQFVTDLRRAGLTFDEIEADADRLAQSIRRLDSVRATVEVEADAADALGDIDRANDQLRALDGTDAKVSFSADGLDDMVDKLGSLPGIAGDLGSKMSDVTGMVGGGGLLATGIAGIATGLIAAANNAADAAVEVKTISDLTGDSMEGASRLTAVWKSSGAEANDLQDVVLQLNGVLADSPELARQLGIDMSDNVSDADRFRQAVELVEGGLIDSTTASQLFGEEGVRQVQGLVTKMGDLEEAERNVADQLIFTSEDATAALEMKRNLAEITTTLEGMAVEIGQGVIPVLSDMLGIFGTLKDTLSGLEGGGFMKEVFLWANPITASTQAIGALNDGLNQFRDNAGVTAGLSAEWTAQLEAEAQAAEEAAMAVAAQGPALDAAGRSYVAQARAIEDAAEETERLRTAADDAIAAMEVAPLDAVTRSYIAQGEAIEEAATATAEHEAAVAENEAAVASHREELERANQIEREAADAIMATVTARRAAADSTFAYRDAERAFAEELESANAVLADSETTIHEAAEAMDGAASSAGSLADAAVRLATDQAAARGETLSAVGAGDVWRRSMLDQASTAQGPLRSAILNYIGSVEGIPEEELTDIRALIDQGKIAEAERKLNTVSRARKSTVTADALTSTAESEINRLTRDRVVRIRAERQGGGWYAPGGGIMMADGGTAQHGTLNVAGETGQLEFAGRGIVTGPTAVPPGTKVTGVRDSADMMQLMIGELRAQTEAIRQQGGGGQQVTATAIAQAMAHTMSVQSRRTSLRERAYGRGRFPIS